MTSLKDVCYLLFSSPEHKVLHSELCVWWWSIFVCFATRSEASSYHMYIVKTLNVCLSKTTCCIWHCSLLRRA